MSIDDEILNILNMSSFIIVYYKLAPQGNVKGRGISPREKNQYWPTVSCGLVSDLSLNELLHRDQIVYIGDSGL